jgi:aminoglycoside 3-N-acetyltransferase
MLSRDDLIAQLRALGVDQAGVLIVHAAFSKVAPVDDGPRGLIDALRTVLWPEGTLVMPSMADDDDVPFDPATSSCIGMGVVADTFWRQPGVRRSDSPHAFAAAGPRADELTTPHPVDVPHGPDSPVGRACALDAQVLLIGVGHDANTTIHLAERLAGVRYRLPAHATVLRGGQPVRVDYGENDCCCARFALVDGWLDAEGAQKRGPVGHAEARLARARDIVRVVTAHLGHDELVFLHPSGVDAECDAARASMPP